MYVLYVYEINAIYVEIIISLTGFLVLLLFRHLFLCFDLLLGRLDLLDLFLSHLDLLFSHLDLLLSHLDLIFSHLDVLFRDLLLGGGKGVLKRKLTNGSHCQELGQLADLAYDRLFILVYPIRSLLDNDYNS